MITRDDAQGAIEEVRYLQGVADGGGVPIPGAFDELLEFLRAVKEECEEKCDD